MLDNGTKRRIDNARDILVGKVPDPKAQVEQITTALIYKFMDDMDQESIALGGKASFFVGEYAKYAWPKVITKSQGGYERLALYSEAITRMSQNPNLPQLFRDIFKDAFLPYRDPETLNLFLKEIGGFKYDNSERLGDAFEYLLSIMGSQGAAGQFRTPRHIIDFIVEVIAPTKTDTVLDPACGTAGFLISAYKHILAKNQEKKLSPDEMLRLTKNFVGYDISPEMVRLSLVNMYLHQFQKPTVYEYDTLTSEERWDDSFDVILANPPFMSPKGGIRPHTRFAVQAKRSEVLFVDYIAEHLNPNGRAGVIVPEGIIFQSAKAYKALRKMLIEEHYLYAVVSLPAGVFNPYSGVKTSILLIDRQLAKQKDDILFINICCDGFSLGAQRNPIDQNDLPESIEIIQDFQKESKDTYGKNVIAYAITKNRIAENGEFGLRGNRYLDIVYDSNLNWPLLEFENAPFEIIDGDRGKNYPKKTDFFNDEYCLFLSTKNVRKNGFKFSELNFIKKEKDNILRKGKLQRNDVVLTTRGTIGNTGWYSNEIQFDHIRINSGMLIFRCETDKILPKFLFHFFQSSFFQNQINNLLSGSAQPQLPIRTLNKAVIPIPPISLQKEIVKEIDGYQKIIDGARQVVENYRPRIKVNPDWPMVELRDLCTSILSGGTPSTKVKEYWEGNIPWISSADISDLKLAEPRRCVTEEAINKSATNLIPKDNVIVATRVGLGKLFLNDFDVCISQDLHGLLVKKKKALPAYLVYALISKVEKFKTNSRGTTIQGVTKNQLVSLMIPTPPIAIQQSVIEMIEEEQKIIDGNKELIEIFEKKIEERIGVVWGEEKEEE